MIFYFLLVFILYGSLLDTLTSVDFYLIQN